MPTTTLASLRFSEKDIRNYLDRHKLSRVIEYPKNDDNLELHELLKKGHRHLARAVEARWRTQNPAVEVPPRIEIETQGKLRPIYRFRFSTLIYHAMTSEALQGKVEQALPASVYSYRIGRSNLLALRQLIWQSRLLRGKQPDALNELHFFKGDIRKYSDNINPNHAAFQTELAQLLQLGADVQNHITELVAATPKLGLYVGSPLANIFQNFYLLPLDALAKSCDPRAFYGRFNDDFLFVSSSASAMQKFRTQMLEVLENRGLQLNADKTIFGIWNGSGFSRIPELKARQHFEWLGYRVDWSGNLSCGSDHVKAFRQDFLFRLRNVRRSALPGFDLTAWVNLINSLLATQSELRCQGTDNILSRTECRTNLKAIDLWVANEVAKIVGPLLKIHRNRLTPRRLFAAGLYSFVAEKNKPRFYRSLS